MPFRRVFHAALIAAAVLLAACTSETSAPPSTEPTTSSSTVTAVPSGPIRHVPGEYTIDISGVNADLSLDDTGGTLTVENGSTIDLGQATISVIAIADTVRADATLDGPDAVAIGEEATYDVELPEGVTADDIGLIRLSFDDVSLAVFAPVIDTSG